MLSRVTKTVVVLQFLWGLTFGFYLFTYGTWFFDSFVRFASVAEAMTLTSLLLAIRQLGVAIFEAPTGALADVIGKKPLIKLAFGSRFVFFVTLAMLGLPLGLTASFAIAVVGSFFFALSSASLNGALSAWIVENCQSLDVDFPYARIITKGHIAVPSGMCAGGIVAVILFLNGLTTWGFGLGAIASAMGFAWSHARISEVKKTFEWRRFSATLSGMRVKLVETSKALRGAPLATMLIFHFASFIFLMNVVEYFWPIALRASIGLEKSSGQWLSILLAVCLLRVLGAMKTASLFSKTAAQAEQMPRLMTWVLVVTCSAAFLVVTQSVLKLLGVDLGGIGIGVVAAATLFAHGAIGGAFDSLICHHLPPALYASRATVLSLGSFFKSAIVVLFAIPSGGFSPGSTSLSWIFPASLVLLLSLLVYRTSLKSRNGIGAHSSK